MTHPAGWHPDPGNPNLERYWDGQQWTDQTRSRSQLAAPEGAGQATKKTRKWPWVLGGAIGVFVLMGIIGNIVGPQEEESTAGASSTTTTAAPVTTTTQPTTTTRTPSSTTAPSSTTSTTTPAPAVPAKAEFSDPRCAPADPAMVEWIAAGLSDSSLTLENAVVIEDDGLLFIGASAVRPDGTFENRSDVWIVQDSMPFASTGGAHNTTAWPKASDALGISPGDELVQAADACVVELTRN